MKTLHFGDVTVDRVVEAEGPGFAPGFLLPDSDAEAIAAQHDWLLPNFIHVETGRLVQSVHCYVVRTPHHTILVDTCVGNDKDRPSTKAWHRLDTPFLDRLAAAGVSPKEVDFVLCTHLHVDHVGWNTRLADGRWVPTFPNARYLFHRTEYEYWETHGDYVTPGRGASDGFFEDSVLPVMEAGRGVLVDGDHSIDDTLWLDPTPGHSPGHVCLQLEAGGARAVFTGDLLHHPVQCAYPEWNSRFCWDGNMSRATRQRFIDHHADTGAVILAAHIATPTAGRVTGPVPGSGGRCRFVV